MPLYKMLCIAAHYPEYKYIKQLVTESAMLVMNQGGVVRSINSLGRRTLPTRMRAHNVNHSVGDYWSMHFDASPRLVHDLSRKMRQDPKVIRTTVLKLGHTLEDIVETKERSVFDDDPPARRPSGFETFLP